MEKKEVYKGKISEALREEEGVLFCYLFGSCVRKDMIQGSDVDLAVYFDKERIKDFFDKRIELIAKFSRLLKKDADVVVLNSASPLLRYVVLKEGSLIFERDKGRRVDFELKSLNEYFDFKPVLEMYNKALLEN